MLKKVKLVLVLAGVNALLLAGCGGESKPESNIPTTDSTTGARVESILDNPNIVIEGEQTIDYSDGSNELRIEQTEGESGN